MRTWSGLIIGALSFRNEYDGHTIDRSMEQVDRIYGRNICILAGDRGYRGQVLSGQTRIMIPDVPKATDSKHTRKKKHKLFRKRAGIEPVHNAYRTLSWEGNSDRVRSQHPLNTNAGYASPFVRFDCLGLAN